MLNGFQALGVAGALDGAGQIKHKAINRASGSLVVVALIAALSAPAHFDAYANDLSDASKEVVQASNQVEGEGKAGSSANESDEESEEKSESSIADAVRTAYADSGSLANDAKTIPITAALALGLAAFALFAVVLKLRA